LGSSKVDIKQPAVGFKLFFEDRIIDDTAIFTNDEFIMMIIGNSAEPQVFSEILPGKNNAFII